MQRAWGVLGSVGGVSIRVVLVLSAHRAALPGHVGNLDTLILGGGGGWLASCRPTSAPTPKGFPDGEGWEGRTEVVAGNTEYAGHHRGENLHGCQWWVLAFNGSSWVGAGVGLAPGPSPTVGSYVKFRITLRTPLQCGGAGRVAEDQRWVHVDVSVNGASGIAELDWGVEW